MPIVILKKLIMRLNQRNISLVNAYTRSKWQKDYIFMFRTNI